MLGNTNIWLQPSQTITVVSSNNRHHCISQAHSLSFFLLIYSHTFSICISPSLLLCLNVLIQTSWNLGSPSYYLVGCYSLPKNPEVVLNKPLYYSSCTQLFLFLTSMITIKGQTITNTAPNTKRSTTSGHKSSITIGLCNYSRSISILREALGKKLLRKLLSKLALGFVMFIDFHSRAFIYWSQLMLKFLLPSPFLKILFSLSSRTDKDSLCCYCRYFYGLSTELRYSLSDWILRPAP